MRPDRLIEEGRALARRSLVLVTEPRPGPIVGAWAIPTDAEMSSQHEMEHVICVECGWFATENIPLDGVLHVFGGEDGTSVDYFTATPVLQPGRFPFARCGGRALWGIEALSVPSLAALAAHGSKEVSDFIRRSERDDSALEAYRDLLEANEPREVRGAVAVLGGWAESWPEDETYREWGTVVLRTIASPEPFYDVWLTKERKLIGITHTID